jgi:hypothetical protein
MNIEEQRTHGDVEHIRLRISKLFTQCLDDIERTLLIAGLTMRDVGIDVEKYVSCGNTCFVELKLKL